MRDMEPAPAQQSLGARVSAEIDRLEFLLVRVGAEFSDDEEEQEDGYAQGGHPGSTPTDCQPVLFAHSTEPRPCTPLGTRSGSTAMPPTKPRTNQRVGEDNTERASPRQRVANVYTRAAAGAVSANCDAAMHPSVSAVGRDDSSSIEAVLLRNIADARQALEQLEWYDHCPLST